jgi:hypothetical protein
MIVQGIYQGPKSFLGEERYIHRSSVPTLRDESICIALVCKESAEGEMFTLELLKCHNETYVSAQV